MATRPNAGVLSFVEFLATSKRSNTRDKVLAAMLYAKLYEGSMTLAVDDIRTLLKRARVQNAATLNVSEVLLRSGEYVDFVQTNNRRRLWQLTKTGEKYVRSHLGLVDTPVAVNDIGMLTQLVAKVNDDDVRDYVSEALICLRSGALRAAVVFLWAGAILSLQELLLALEPDRLNASLVRYDPKARTIKTLDDFGNVKESNLLLVAQELGAVDKGQRQMLEHALDLRNKCGHAGKYSPGPKRVSAFIEDVMKIIFRVQ